MSNIKAYMNFLNITLNKMLRTLGVIYIIISLGMSTFYIFISQHIQKNDAIFSSGLIGAIISCSFMIGILLSIKEFNGAMRIRADRKGYFVASIISIFIFIFSMIFVSMAGDFVISKILSLVTGVDIRFSPASPITFETNRNGFTSTYGSQVKSMSNLFYFVYMMLSCMTLAIVGYFFGCIGYRLKLRSNIAIFAGIPFIFISLVIRAGIMGNMEFLEKLGNIGLLLVGSSIESIIVKLVILILAMVMSYLLINKAPIKEYANDLL